MKTEVTPSWGTDNEGKATNLGTKVIEHEGFTPESFNAMSEEEQTAACRLLDKQTFISFGARYARVELAKELPAKKSEEKQPEYENRTYGVAREIWEEVEYPKTSKELFSWGVTTMRKENDGASSKVKAATEAAVKAVLEAMAEAMGISVEEAKVLFEAKKNK
jgi:hypothetical protein